MNDKPKPQERKEHKELSSAPVANASSGIITVPVVNYKIDAKTRALLDENFVLKEEDKETKTEKEIKTVRDENITNLQKEQMLKNFHYQLIVAIASLKGALAGSPTAEITQDSLRELLKGIPENSGDSHDPASCFVCMEEFSTDDRNERYPYINSEGETLTRDCFKGKFGEESIYNRKKLLKIKHKDGQLLRVPNHDLVNLIKNRSIFIDRFIAVAALLLSGKAQPVAEEKSSHTTTTSSSSSAQAAVRPSHEPIDPDMMVFLLRMGLFQSASLQKFSAKAIDNLLQIVCLTEGLSGAFSGIIKELINKPDAEGRAPLMRAVEAENLPLAQTLLRQGADASLRNEKNGNTIFHYLANQTYMVNSEMLPSKAEVVANQTLWLPFFDELLTAVKTKLLKDGEKESKDSQQQDQRMVDFINAKNNSDGSTTDPSVSAWEYAFIRNNIGLLGRLVTVGPMPVCNYRMESQISFKIVDHREDMVRFIFENGVDVYLEDEVGHNVWLTYAIKSRTLEMPGDRKMVRLILQIMQEKAKADKRLLPAKVKAQENALMLAVDLAHTPPLKDPLFSPDIRYTDTPYFDSIAVLLEHETQLSKNFVEDFPEGKVKKYLESCLKTREKRRAKKAKAKKKEKQKGLVSSEEVVDDNEGFPVEDAKNSAPAEMKASTVSADISAKTFEPLLRELKSSIIWNQSRGNADGGVFVSAFFRMREICQLWAIDDKGMYSCLRQARALSVAMDAIDEFLKGGDQVSKEELLAVFGQIFLSTFPKEKTQIRDAAIEVFASRLSNESIKSDFRREAGTISLDQNSSSSSSSSVDQSGNSSVWKLPAAVPPVEEAKDLLSPLTSQETFTTDPLDHRSVWGTSIPFLGSSSSTSSNIADSKISSSLSTQQSENSNGVGSSPSFLDVSTISPADDKESGLPDDEDLSLPDELLLQGLKSAKSKELIDSFNKLPSVVNKDNFEDVWKDFRSCINGCMAHLDKLNRAGTLTKEASAFKALLVKKVNKKVKIFLDSNLSEEQKKVVEQWIEANVHFRLVPGIYLRSLESQHVNDKSFR